MHVSISMQVVYTLNLYNPETFLNDNSLPNFLRWHFSGMDLFPIDIQVVFVC